MLSLRLKQRRPQMEATQNNKPEKKKRKLYISEIVWYCIIGTIWLFGFVLAILGVCAYNVGDISANKLYAAEKALGEFLGWESRASFAMIGTVIMVIAMICFFIAIYAYAYKASETENTQRRLEERRKILEESDVIATPEAQAAQEEAAAAPAQEEAAPVEAESSPAEEAAPEEPSQPEEEPAEDSAD